MKTQSVWKRCAVLREERRKRLKKGTVGGSVVGLQLFLAFRRSCPPEFSADFVESICCWYATTMCCVYWGLRMMAEGLILGPLRSDLFMIEVYLNLVILLIFLFWNISGWGQAGHFWTVSRFCTKACRNFFSQASAGFSRVLWRGAPAHPVLSKKDKCWILWYTMSIIC